ncbi:MAG: hypothetical protein LBQ52_04680 [Helicobacteraceae bacterium]|jgi:hypothetical protein|nr:hypothetical protein [Helicobacteraceae bacterium]
MCLFGDGFGGIRTDYLFVRDYCAEYGFNRIKTYKIIKEMASDYAKIINEKNAKKRKK